MGTVTHGSVQAIDVNTHFQRVNGEQNLDLSVYKMVTENVYYTQIKGKLRRLSKYPFTSEIVFKR